MPTHAAFLRGINLGRRRLTGEELRGHLTAAGLEDVATFRASGNVVFAAPAGSGESELRRHVEGALAEALGYEVAAFLRPGAEVLAIAAHEPFDAAARARLAGKPQVMLLSEHPGGEAAGEALALAGPDDALALHGRELHWLPAGPMSESALDTRALARLLGPGTIRTKGTIELIAARHFAP